MRFQSVNLNSRFCQRACLEQSCGAMAQPTTLRQSVFHPGQWKPNPIVPCGSNGSTASSMKRAIFYRIFCQWIKPCIGPTQLAERMDVTAMVIHKQHISDRYLWSPISTAHMSHRRAMDIQKPGSCPSQKTCQEKSPPAGHFMVNINRNSRKNMAWIGSLALLYFNIPTNNARERSGFTTILWE